MKRVRAFFYRTDSGSEPVREWLASLEKDEKRVIGRDIMTLEFGWPIGMPLSRSLGSGLHEARSHFRDRIARVIFCVEGDRMYLLHGFIKKSQKLPARDLRIARARKRELGL